MKERLSETRIRAAKLPADVTELSMADGDGLYLRLRRSRADPRTVTKVWVFISKTGGRQRKVGLGALEDVSLAAARAKAEALRARRDAGGVPTADTANAALRTLADLFTRHEALRKPSADRTDTWTRYVAPTLGRVRLEDLNRRHIVGLLDDLRLEGRRRVAAGGQHDMLRTAGRTFGLLKQLCAFGTSRGVLASDPMSGMKRRDFGHQGIARERILSAEELTEVSRRAGQTLRVGPKGREFDVPVLHPAAQAACWFLVATVARVGELGAMRMRDLDLKAKTWTIPATVAKNGREHVVALSPFALRMLDAMRRMPTRPAGDKSSKPADTVFYGADTLSKSLLTRQRVPAARPLAKHHHSAALLLPGGAFVPHDLRRTGASLMQTLGVPPHVIEQCLNHTLAGVARVYQRAQLLDERRAAFDKLGALLERVIDTGGIDRALARAEAA